MVNIGIRDKIIKVNLISAYVEDIVGIEKGQICHTLSGPKTETYYDVKIETKGGGLSNRILFDGNSYKIVTVNSNEVLMSNHRLLDEELDMLEAAVSLYHIRNPHILNENL